MLQMTKWQMQLSLTACSLTHSHAHFVPANRHDYGIMCISNIENRKSPDYVCGKKRIQGKLANINFIRDVKIR